MPRIQPDQTSEYPINIYKTMAVAPSVLQGHFAMKKELGDGSLSPQLCEKIALTAAALNQCDYCTKAHTHIARKAGLSESEIEFASKGQCGDPKTNAALQLTTALIEKRGHIDDQDFANAKDAGWNDQEIIEIFAQTMANMFTNYFNDFLQVDYDDDAVQGAVNKAA